MQPIQVIIAFLSAGVALFAGLVSLFTGLHKDGEKADLVFGVLCIAIVFYFFFPPLGFIVVDKAPYSLEIITKRFFNFLFFGLFPWFVFSYTQYKKKLFPTIISSLCIVTYFLMAFTSKDTQGPLWVFTALANICISIIYGFLAVSQQFKSGERKNAKWFGTAMCVYLLLFLLTAIYQFNNEYFIRLFHAKIFYPINLFPLAFILIMGVRLRNNSLDRVQLKKSLGLKTTQWESLLQNMQLIVILTDNKGVIRFINPFGFKLLEFNHAKEIVGKNWFDFFMPGPETGFIKSLFQSTTPAVPHLNNKNAIITNTGVEKMVSWNNELILDENGILTGIMSVGSDITKQEKDFEQIQRLKAELEKENLLLKGEPVPDYMLQEIVGESEAITYAIQKARKVATSHASVLLEGETGVGKELFADLIQRTSMRKDEPFIKVNCGALPAELIEDELFGHEKGAFTGAQQPRKGRFEMAHGGTIFLDEIGELPLSLQPKLLRVLQNGEFERIGGQQTIKVDVRIIAATNRNLEIEVEEGRFRDDLFYRLNVYPITIPALKNRKEDIPLLIKFFIDKISRKYDKQFGSISKAEMNQLCEYEWRGNIRELKNVIERSVISSEGPILRLDWFYHGMKTKNLAGTAAPSLEQIEKDFILKTLLECNWQISGEKGAAEKLVLHPNTLRSRMKKLNIIKQNGSQM
jgi:PAS domain S-box-containing protein